MNENNSNNNYKKKENENWYYVSHTRKDIILYALSIGFGSSNNTNNNNTLTTTKNNNNTTNNSNNTNYHDESVVQPFVLLQYIYENHPNFTIVPTFYLIVPFYAIPFSTTSNVSLLSSWSYSSSSTFSTLPNFPPPIMQQNGIIPQHHILLRNESDDTTSNNNNNNTSNNNIDLGSYPLIHTFQSITWNDDNYDNFDPTPTVTTTTTTTTNEQLLLKSSFVSILPKLIGTFVTTETCIVHPGYQQQLNEQPSVVCTIQSTTLILGIDPEIIIPLQPLTPKDNKNTTNNIPFFNNNKPSITSKNDNIEILFEQDHYIDTNTSLLYRIASGDTNSIHIDPTTIPDLLFNNENDTTGNNDNENDTNNNNSNNSPRRPIVHGLWTMGIVVRYLYHYIHTKLLYNNNHTTIKIGMKHMEMKFVQPIFVNDTIRIRIYTIRESGSKNDSPIIKYDTTTYHDNRKIPYYYHYYFDVQVLRANNNITRKSLSTLPVVVKDGYCCFYIQNDDNNDDNNNDNSDVNIQQQPPPAVSSSSSTTTTTISSRL